MSESIRSGGQHDQHSKKGAASNKESNPLLGWMCIALGLFPQAIALGWLAPDPASIHAPLWVISLSGWVFVAGGVLVLLGPGKRVNHLFAGVIVLSFALVSGWASLFGPAEGFSGGIPFLPDAFNVKLARVIFGACSLMCLAIFVHAMRLLISGKQQHVEMQSADVPQSDDSHVAQEAAHRARKA